MRHQIIEVNHLALYNSCIHQEVYINSCLTDCQCSLETLGMEGGSRPPEPTIFGSISAFLKHPKMLGSQCTKLISSQCIMVDIFVSFCDMFPRFFPYPFRFNHVKTLQPHLPLEKKDTLSHGRSHGPTVPRSYGPTVPWCL